jgi:ketosteroid isomerase-like protein
MKNALLCICFLVLTLPILAQTTSLAASMETQKTAASMTPSVNTEEEAIKKVVTGATDAYVKRDFKTWADSYVDAATTSTIITPNGDPGSMRATSDFQKISKGMKSWMEASPQSEMQVTSCDGWICRINGNMAWISYDEYNVMVKTGAKIKSRELRVMEKIDSQWKISSQCSVWDFKNAEMPTPNLEEETIKKIISEEGIAFSQGNVDAFMDTYHAVPYLLWTVTNGMEPGDVLTFRGPEELKTFAQSLPWFKSFDPKNVQKHPTDTSLRDNWNIQFKNNIAIANFDEHWINDKEKQKLNLTGIKILEKINGQWKIIMTSALADFKDATPPIRSKY